MKKIFILFLFVLFLIFLIFFSCTTQGMELSLVGNWNVIDMENDTIPIDIDDVDGTLVLTSDDRYEIDIELTLENGFEYEIDDDGTTKADWVTDAIQFFTNNDDEYDDENYTYTLSNCGNNLLLENDDVIIECTKN